MNLDQSSYIPLGAAQVEALCSPENHQGSIRLLQQCVLDEIKRSSGAILVLDARVNATTLGDRCTPDNLHTVVKECLDILFRDAKVRTQILPNGTLEVTDRLPPFVCEASDIQRQCQNIHVDNADSICGYIDGMKKWPEHHKDTLARVRSEKQKRHGLTENDVEMLVRGCAGEILLQHILQCIEADQSNAHERSIRMPSKENPCVLPKPMDAQKQYAAVFSTRYNCELRKTHAYDARRKDLSAEFDGVLLSGLDPSKKENFSRFYVFDCTRSRNCFDDKMHHAVSSNLAFIELMRHFLIEVHIFNVLFSERSSSLVHPSASPRCHAITLPLLGVADGIAERLLSDLQPHIREILISGKTQRQYQKQSS